MKRKIIIIVSALTLFASGTAFGGAINGTYNGFNIVKIMSGGKEIKDEIPAHIIDGKTMVPLTTLRTLGAEVTWNADNYQVGVEFPQALTDAQKAEIQRNVGIVYTHNSDGTWSQGTAFMIEGGKFLTAYHVVEQGGKIGEVRVDLNGKTYEKVPVIWYDEGKDVAQLQLSADVPGLKVQKSKWLDGQKVYAVGYPKGKLAWSEGVTITNDGSHTASVIGGSSGGPALNSLGQVVGVNYFKVSDDIGGQTVSAPLSTFLNNLK